MATYTVLWRIDIEADYALDAAKQALEIQRDPESTAEFFEVVDDTGCTHTVDLMLLREE